MRNLTLKGELMGNPNVDFLIDENQDLNSQQKYDSEEKNYQLQEMINDYLYSIENGTPFDLDQVKNIKFFIEAGNQIINGIHRNAEQNIDSYQEIIKKINTMHNDAFKQESQLDKVLKTTLSSNNDFIERFD